MPSAYEKYEHIIVEHEGETVGLLSLWDDQGRLQLDFFLLEELLSRSVRDGDSARSGGLALALDMWLAEELRRAGFDEDAIWPRLHAPHVLDPAVIDFVNALSPSVAEECCKALPRYARNKANVLGAAYRKQVDVGMSSWMTGPEILISTKTMMSSYGKNLANRFEEAYGDAKNLKGRHPLAALGFYFLMNADISNEPATFAKALSMLEKLQLEDDAYDAACLQLVEIAEDGSVTISECNEFVPESLSPEHFFATIIDDALVRAASDAHAVVKANRAGHTTGREEIS